MPASAGTPTVFQKFGAFFGLDGAENATVLAGDKADAQKLLAELESLFGPTLANVESDALADLNTFLQDLLKALPTITSIASAVSFVKAAASSAGGSITAQVEGLGETALVTLVSAALTAIGKVNVPLA